MIKGILLGVAVLGACCGFSFGNLGMFREQWYIWHSQQPQQRDNA